VSFTWTDWRRCGFCERLCHPDRLGTTLAHPRHGAVVHICTECFSDRLTVTRTRPRSLFRSFFGKASR
jgi:hypothetical protein